MGNSKFLEDNLDRYYENSRFNNYINNYIFKKDKKEERSYNEDIDLEEEINSNKTRKCYYCDHLVDNLNEMNEHIKEKHNTTGPILLLNDKVVQHEKNVTYEKVYIDTIRSAKIIMCGHNEKIKVSKKYIDQNNDIINLKSIINIEKLNSFKIEIGGKVIKIKKYEEKNIKNIIVENILNNWEIQLEKNKSLSPDPSQYPKKLNEVEKRYLNGFYNYYLACSNNIGITDKKNRYYESFSILSSFLSLKPKGRIVLKIIAFKNNWIDKLDNLCSITSGTFNEIVDFYKNRPSKNEKNSNSQIEENIFIEPSIQESIDAIIALQQGDEESCLEYLNFWTDERIKESQLESNEVDRILYLKSFFYIRNRGLFKNYYREIKTPFLKNNLNLIINERDEK